MCNSVFYDDAEYDTPRKLATLIGGAHNLIWHGHTPFYPPPDGEDWKDLDLCLCQIDLAATLEKAGFGYRRGTDPMEWFVTLRP
jgi:hypothetical protein